VERIRVGIGGGVGEGKGGIVDGAGWQATRKREEGIVRMKRREG
jgi:hypothetical protein